MRRIFVVLFCLPLFAFARDSLNVTQLAQVVIGWEQPCDIVVRGDLAFVPCGYSGLRIVNISDLDNPVEIGSYSSRARTTGVAVQNNYAFLAEGENGLTVIDFANPASPVMVAQSNPGNGDYERIAIRDSTAYVTIPQLGIQMFDISDPLNPTPMFYYEMDTGPRDIVISGLYGYVATDDGMVILELSDPTQPISFGTLTGFAAQRIDVLGSHAFVVGPTEALKIIDILLPDAPVLIGESYAAFDATDLAISGDFVYATTSWSIVALNVSESTAPVFVASYPTTEPFSVVTAVGNSLFASNRMQDFMTFDISVPVEISFLGALSRPEELTATAVSGNYAYVAGQTRTLQVLDISNPTLPVLLNTIQTTGSANDLYIVGTQLYSAEASNIAGLGIYDIANPSAPTPLSFLNLSDYPTGIVVRGDYAYVSASSAMFVVNITNPVAPVVVDDIPAMIAALNLAVSGQNLYVADYAYVRIYDLTNPNEPLPIGLFDSPSGVYDIAISGDIAYLAEGSGVRTVDVSNPVAPIPLDSFALPSTAQEIYLDGSIAYVTAGEYGMRMLDISNPSDLREIGSYVEDFDTKSLFALGSIVYAAEEFKFSVYDVSAALSTPEQHNDIATQFSLHPIYPNPFNNTANISFDLPREVTGRLVVYDLLGREASVLYNGRLTSGTHSMQFNGDNLSSGSYFIRLESPAFTATRKATLLK